MDKRTPISAYKLFSSPSNKQIVFDSFYETPCRHPEKRVIYQKNIDHIAKQKVRIFPLGMRSTLFELAPF